MIRSFAFAVLLTVSIFNFSHAQDRLAVQCSGSSDTQHLSELITDLKIRGGSLRLPAKGSAQCVTDSLVIPPNVSVDNSDGGGIKINTGKVLTILGPIISPLNNQLFINALAGQGSVSLKDNRYLSILYPEWWGAKTTRDDSAALNACSAAAATLSAGDIDLSGTYNLTATWQVGVGTPFTYITLKGHGAGSGGTTLNWIGASDGLMLKFWANKYSNIERIRFQNSMAFGRTVGLRFSGPGTGTQSNNYNIDNCVFTGFYRGLEAGDPETPAAVSELSFRNVAFDGNENGFIGLSTGNTLVISFLNCSFANNKTAGLNLGSSSDCHIFGGGFGSNGADILATGWTRSLSVIGARFEMLKSDTALTVGSVGTVAVRNCTFSSEPTEVPTHSVIQGETNLTLENNVVGRPGEAWVFYDFGTGGIGKKHQFVATNNIVYGKLLDIRLDNSAIDGLTTITDGVRGEVVWPNAVPDATAGEGRLVSGATHVKLVKRRNSKYSITLSSDSDERLHFENKTAEGFDVVSSNRTSASNFTWTIMKN